MSLSSIQIERWCENPSGDYTDLWLYAGLSIGSGVAALLRALLMLFSALYLGASVHEKMIKGLMYASIPEFFDRVPSGRILNRVSKDLTELDENVGYEFGGFLTDLFMLLGNLVICVYASTPFVLVPIAVSLLICRRLQIYLMKSQRECVRLEGISNSPIVSGFSETMNGLPTIRSYKLEHSFMDKQVNLVNTNKRTRMARAAFECWFAQRVTWLSYIISISAIAYCLFSDQTNGSMAGLLLAYSFTVDENVIFLVYSLADTEAKMVSVERVANFMKIEPEKGYACLPDVGSMSLH